jgi:hypothetical protein
VCRRGLCICTYTPQSSSAYTWTCHPLKCEYKYAKVGIDNAWLIRDQRYRTGPDTGMPMPDWHVWLSAKNADAGLNFFSAFPNLFTICQHHKVSLTPPGIVYRSTWCIPVHYKQYGRAGCIPVHHKQYGRAGCFSSTSSLDVQCRMSFHHKLYGMCLG